MMFNPGILSALDFIDIDLHAGILARTSTVDVTTELQCWLDAASEQLKKAYLPAGLYNISRPLFVTRTLQSGFATNHVEGDGGGYDLQQGQSVLVASHLDAPALIVNRARGVRIAHIQIRGANTAQPGFIQTDERADYLSPGARFSQYSPHCGIGIDATSGPIPPDGGYPGLTYDAEVGGSHQVHIQNVTIWQFVVGLMVSPGLTQNADNIVFENGHIGICETAAAYGQSQTRNNVVSNSNIERARNGFSAFDYGVKQGALPIMENSQIGLVNRVFEASDQFGSATMRGCYMESCNVLGTFGQGFSSSKFFCRVSDSQFHFSQNFQTNRNPVLILESYGPTNLDGVHIQSNDSTARVLNFGGDGIYRWQSCTFSANWRDGNNINALIGNRIVLFPGLAFGEIYNSFTMSNADGSYNIVHNQDTVLTLTSLVTTAFVIDAGQVTFTLSTQSEGSQLSVGQIVMFTMSEQGTSLTKLKVPALEIASIDLGTGDIVCSMLFEDVEYFEPSTIFRIDAIVSGFQSL